MNANPGNIFTWSTPAPNIDGSIPAPWRVTHRDRMTTYLADNGYPSAVAYVEHEGNTPSGRRRMWVGLRDNRDRAAHSAALLELAAKLKKAGFVVRNVKGDGRVVALHVLDDHR